MEFPLRLEAGAEVDVTINDVPLRFRVTYRHMFPDASALERSASAAWCDHYDGLTLIGGKSYKEWDTERWRLKPSPSSPPKPFTAKMDIEFEAVDLFDAYSQIASYFAGLSDDWDPYFEHTGLIEVNPKD